MRHLQPWTHNNAKDYSCEIIMNPKEQKYVDPSIRDFQGCPTVAVTPRGRIYAGWYAGGTREPHMDNFNLLVYSDDCGESWSAPLLVIPSNKELCIHALDIQLWMAPNGSLHLYWVQNNTCKYTEELGENYKNRVVDGYMFGDRIHAEWRMICSNPDADQPVFSEPEYLDVGFLRCKPLYLRSGRIINFNYDQTNNRYGYSISNDGGVTYTHFYGGLKVDTPFDESMAYERLDGSIRMLARSSCGYLAESYSFDGGNTWTDGALTEIESPNTRCFVARTPSGRILMINNDHKTDRCRMAAYLSEDDGVTWKYKRVLDPRMHISYPDVDFYDGKIYLVHDHDRVNDREILFYTFTEDELMDENSIIEPIIICKP